MGCADYKCCCNTHVHSAILAIAIVGWLLGGGALIVIIISLQWLFLPIPLLAAFGNLMLLIGRCTKTACLYWIYFICQIIMAAGTIAWAVILFQQADQIMKGKYYTFLGTEYKYDKGWGIYFIVLGCIGVVYTLLNLYFTYIAVKAYRYLVNVLNTHQHNVDTVITTQQTAFAANPGGAPYPQVVPGQQQYNPSYPQAFQQPYPSQVYPAHSQPDPYLPAGVPGQGFQIPPPGAYPDLKSHTTTEQF